MSEYSYPKNKIKFLLLENIHPVAVETLKSTGYDVHVISRSLKPEELVREIKDVHVLGIRSKTKVSAEAIQAAKRLLAIGCFGVGTNQVALDAATSQGVPVFNAPYGNTRSVAELAVADIIMLARKAAGKNSKMHGGHWDKSAKGAHEIRLKTLGVVGFGHIGQQVGIMAEALGMRVLFYDVTSKLPFGNQKQASSLKELLGESDFVSLHVPARPDGEPLIGKKELAQMKPGSCLLNLSRGTLIDFSALREAIESRHLAGAAVDVYPEEPKTNDEPFACELAGLENVILTPHLGGSTEEAQYNIGQEVASAFVQYIDRGNTGGAVNFPRLVPPEFPNTHRILHIHKNVSGVIREINELLSDVGANVEAQFLGTYKDIGYVIVDVDKELSEEVKEKISSLPSTIKTRVLY